MSDDGEIDQNELTESQLLDIAREEAHRTIDNQIETLDDIDNKAAKIMRLNLILLGVLLTGISVVASNNPSNEFILSTASVLNIYSISGLVCILISTVLAAFTYTATSQRAGMSGRDIANMTSNHYTPIENYRGLVESYSRWMQYNFKVNTRSAPLGTGMLLFLIYGIILFSAGFYHTLVQTMGIGGVVTIFILLTAITWKSGIKGQMERYWKYKDHDPGKD